MKKEVSWENSTGHQIKVVISLKTEKEVNLDGQIDYIPCCDIDTLVYLDGEPEGCIISEYGIPQKYLDMGIVAVCGRLAFNRDKYNKIFSVVNNMKSTPEYQSKLKKIKENEESVKKYEATKQKNGYCTKCHSYCYGDCEAN